MGNRTHDAIKDKAGPIRDLLQGGGRGEQARVEIGNDAFARIGGELLRLAGGHAPGVGPPEARSGEPTQP
jgi:hypothetical protein